MNSKRFFSHRKKIRLLFFLLPFVTVFIKYFNNYTISIALIKINLN